MLAVQRRLPMSINRIREILKSAGFYIPEDGGTAKKVYEHFSGRYFIPIPKELSSILDGLLLGDGNMKCSSDPLDTERFLPLSKYQDALNTSHHLVKSLRSNDIDVTEAATKRNRALEVISKARTAFFNMHKSALEEPWLHFLAQKFRTHGYQVTISPRGTIEFRTCKTVQLYVLYQQWYPRGIKQLSHMKLTPFSLLCWYVGDGSSSKTITFSTQSFTKAKNEYLVSLLDDLGIIAKVASTKDKRTGKVYHYLYIPHRHRSRVLDYFNSAHEITEAMSLVKRLLPWKFDLSIRRKDVYDPVNEFVDEDWLRTFLNLLKQVGVDISERSLELHLLFPWKFPLPRV